MIMRYVYSDGSAPSNGSKDCVAGWGAIEVSGDDLVRDDILQVKSGYILPEPGVEKPTSIRAELTGAINALKLTDHGDIVKFYCDSAYVINGINQKWYLNWFRTGKNSLGKTPANMDLWTDLVNQIRDKKYVQAIHLRGHAGQRFQEMCDSLAVSKSAEGKSKYRPGV